MIYRDVISFEINTETRMVTQIHACGWRSTAWFRSLMDAVEAVEAVTGNTPDFVTHWSGGSIWTYNSDPYGPAWETVPTNRVRFCGGATR